MITELEKQFFSTFGIEPFIYCSKPRLDCDARSKGSCRKDCEYYSGVLYPQITDRILLKLICLLSEWRTCLHSDYTVKADNVSSLKEDVLKDFLELFKWYEFKKCEKGIKQQVQALFKE